MRAGFVVKRFLCLLYVCLVALSCRASNPSSSLDTSHRARRIVVLGIPLFLDILHEYHEESSVVAVVDSPNLPNSFLSLPRVGTSLLPNVEAVLAQRPDLVLGATTELRFFFPSHVQVFVSESMIENTSDLRGLFEQIGRVLGKTSTEIEQVVSRFENEIHLAIPSQIRCPPKRLAFLFPSSDGMYYTVGTHSMEHEVIRLLGGEHVLSEASLGKPVSIEGIFATQPDAILTDVSMVSRFSSDPRLSKGSAAIRRQVIGIRTSDLVSTRLPQVLRDLTQALYTDGRCIVRSLEPK